MVIVVIVPDTVGWYIAKGRLAEARQVLAVQHADGAEDDLLVREEVEMISAAIGREAETKLNFRSLFKTPANRRRFLILIVCGFGSQMNGVGLFSYYLVPVLCVSSCFQRWHGQLTDSYCRCHEITGAKCNQRLHDHVESGIRHFGRIAQRSGRPTKAMAHIEQWSASLFCVSHRLVWDLCGDRK